MSIFNEKQLEKAIDEFSAIPGNTLALVEYLDLPDEEQDAFDYISGQNHFEERFYLDEHEVWTDLFDPDQEIYFLPANTNQTPPYQVIVWQLANDKDYGEDAGKYILTTADGKHDIGKKVYDTEEQAQVSADQLNIVSTGKPVPLHEVMDYADQHGEHVLKLSQGNKTVAIDVLVGDEKIGTCFTSAQDFAKAKKLMQEKQPHQVKAKTIEELER